MDDTLEILLREHRVPPANARLEQRILAGASPREMRPGIRQALAELLRPAPVAAFACSLMLGLIMGQHIPYSAAPAALSASAPQVSHNAGAFLYYNGEVL